MRIAIDHEIFCRQAYGGISRYFVSLAQELLTQGHDVRLYAPLHRNRYIEELPPGTVEGRRLGFMPPKTTKLLLLYNQFLAERAIHDWKPDIIHATYYNGAMGKVLDRYPSIVTVHDMIHEIFPEDFLPRDPTSRRKRNAVAHASHVICVSQNTRTDLIRLFGTAEEKVSVVHHGCNSFGNCPEFVDTEPDYVERPFILYVGDRAGYKNFSGLLGAFARSQRLRKDFGIVAFGGGPLSRDESIVIDGAGIRADQIRRVSGGDAVLRMLYRRAGALVYPSLYEGFGLPPLEAMAHRCPVVCSNASSIPEVVGNAAEYFDPRSAEDIAQALERVLYDEDLAADLIARGLERAGHFSWQRCGEETLSVYRKVGRS